MGKENFFESAATSRLGYLVALQLMNDRYINFLTLLHRAMEKVVHYMMLPKVGANLAISTPILPTIHKRFLKIVVLDF